jgi:hypothetical protein
MSRGDRATCLGRQRFPGLPLTTYASSGAPSNTTSPEIMPGAYHTLSTQLHQRGPASPVFDTRAGCSRPRTVATMPQKAAQPQSRPSLSTFPVSLHAASVDHRANAATQPRAAKAIAGRSRGESGLAGGASSNVSTDRTSALAAIAAMILHSGRQA